MRVWCVRAAHDPRLRFLKNTVPGLVFLWVFLGRLGLSLRMFTRTLLSLDLTDYRSRAALHYFLCVLYSFKLLKPQNTPTTVMLNCDAIVVNQRSYLFSSKLVF